MVYSMGLSGFFFDYPVGLMVAIFLLLATPLALVALKSPRAPRWNIAQLWIVVALMAVRAVSVFLFPMRSEGQPPISSADTPAPHSSSLSVAFMISPSIWAHLSPVYSGARRRFQTGM